MKASSYSFTGYLTTGTPSTFLLPVDAYLVGVDMSCNIDATGAASISLVVGNTSARPIAVCQIRAGGAAASWSSNKYVAIPALFFPRNTIFLPIAIQSGVTIDYALVLFFVSK